MMLQPSYCLNAYTGHSGHVMSLDFHPKKNDLFCFCDSMNEIRYWNVSPFQCARVSKVGFFLIFPDFGFLYLTNALLICYYLIGSKEALNKCDSSQ